MIGLSLRWTHASGPVDLVAKKKRLRRRAREKEKRIETELKVKSVQEREEAEAKNEREGEKAPRENQPGRHSSRVCTTSLCDFYTRSDFLAAPLARTRQIYVPWPYKSRAYKDIETKPTRIPHPILSARFSSPFIGFLLLDSRCPIIPFATILGIPFFPTNRLPSPSPFPPPSALGPRWVTRRRRIKGPRP